MYIHATSGPDFRVPQVTGMIMHAWGCLTPQIGPLAVPIFGILARLERGVRVDLLGWFEVFGDGKDLDRPSKCFGV